MYQRLRNYLKQSAFVLALLVGSSSFLQAQNWDKVIKAVAGDRENRNSYYRAENAMYGYSVAVSGDFAVIGATGERQNDKGNNQNFNPLAGEGAGAVYVLQNVNGTWNTIKKLSAPIRNGGDNFGSSVGISGDFIVVGAPGDASAGAIYVFEKNRGGENSWGLVNKITAPVRGENDNFGKRVSISGDYIVVGADQEKENELEQSTLFDSGSAYIFKKDQGGATNWGFIKKLTAPIRKATDYFGSSVSIDGEYVVVGANKEDEDESESNSMDNSGSAYVFWKNQGGSDNWGVAKKLTAPTRRAEDNFGVSVSISGEYLVVGADSEDEDAQDQNEISRSGSAYIYKKDEGGHRNWGFIKKITAPVRKTDEYFGQTVIIKGDYVVVGSIGDTDVSGQNIISKAGSAYIYKVNQGGGDNWGFVKKIAAGVRSEEDYFGSAVAMGDNFAFVGAFKEDENEVESDTKSTAGSVYIFKMDSGGEDSWGQSQKTVAMERIPGDFFGISVAISGNYAVVGSSGDAEDRDGKNFLSGSGSVYIFQKQLGNWVQIQKLTAPVRDAESFGASVSIDNEVIAIGAYGRLATYIYKKTSDQWEFVKRIESPEVGKNNSFGRTVSVSGNYVLVAAPADYEGTYPSITLNNAGAVYLFRKDFGGSDNWGYVKKLTAPVRASGDVFGGAIAIQDDYILVGAYGEDEGENEDNTLSGSGSSYLFRKDKGGNDNWGFIKKLTAANRESGASFGASVSLWGNRAIVGAYYENASSKTHSGSAYIFYQDEGNIDNWVFTKKINPTSQLAEDNFGKQVAIYQDYAIVSGYSWEGDNAGKAHVFERNSGGENNWGQARKLTAAVPANYGFFGSSVAIGANDALVGAYWESEDVNEKNTLINAGSAYFFERACSEPLTLASSNITNKTATISWAEPLSVPGGGYEYYYSTSSTTPADNVTISGSTSTTSASLSGLEPATTYYFWVRSSCSVGYSSVWVAGGSFTTEACPATIAGLTVPTEVGTYQSVNTIQEGNLTHYCDCANNLLLLTLDQTGSGAVIPDNGIKVKVGGGASYYTNGTGFVTNTHGTAMFNRWWSVVPTIQPTASVKVRAYYTPADYTAVNSTLTSNGKAPMGSESQLFFYKVTDSSLGEFPAVGTIGTDKVILITNGLSAGLNSWVKGSFGDDSYAEFLVSSFSGGGGGGSPSEALPVTLVSFKAVKKELVTELKWSTSSESNTAYFGIERSSDGRTWSSLGEEPAAGESNGVRNYTFTDSRPLSGKNYYRLKSVDRDGTFALSRIEQVTFTGDGTLVLYPNPVSDKLYLKGIGEIASVEIINGLGQIVSQSSGYPKEGLSTSKLNSGLYSVRVKMVDGSSQFHKVVVIK